MSRRDNSYEKRPLLSESDSPSQNGTRQQQDIPVLRESRLTSQGTRLRVETHYRPKPISALSPRKLGVILCILSTELCERLSYYGVVANLVLFCTNVLDFTDTDAASISLIFSGTTYLMPVIGGYIADAHAGKYNTIYGSSLIYLLGLFLLPCSAVDYADLFGDDKYSMSVASRRAFYLVGLSLVSMGTGGIKANVGPFGALQVQDVGPSAVQTFFNWFYWFVNAGALIAYVGVAAVQQNISFAWGFLIPFLSMLLALLFFLLARKNYRYRPIKGSMLVDSFKVCWQGCRRSSRQPREERGLLDAARTANGGGYSDEVVDGVVAVVRVLPIFLMVIMYWAVYSQMQSTFFLQGERMDLTLGSVQVPVAMLNAFNTIAIMLIIPLMDRVVYPRLEKMGCPLSHLHRIGIGFVLAALSMVAAAVVETERKDHLGFDQTVGGDVYLASNLSVFLQVPQFILVGSSEVFTSISGLEFAYTQSPVSMQGVMMGVFMATTGLGGYLASAILAIVQAATKSDPWFPDELNDGKAENLFYLMSVLMGVFLLCFMLAARLYKYRPVKQTPSPTQSSSDEDSGRQTRVKDNGSNVTLF